MEDGAGGVAIEEFVGLKPKMYLSLKTIVNIKKQNAWVEMLQQHVIMNIKISCWIKNYKTLNE